MVKKWGGVAMKNAQKSVHKNINSKYFIVIPEFSMKQKTIFAHFAKAILLISS